MNANTHTNKGLNKSQAGVTLLLAVFILSMSVVISFSVGALVLREIRASREQAKSEPLITAAEAGAETTLFFQIRKLNTAMTSVCPATDTVNLPSGATAASCRALYDSPYIFSSDAANIEGVLLYDPLNVNNMAAGYSSLYITVTSTSPGLLLAQAQALDIDDPANPATQVWSAPFAVTTASPCGVSDACHMTGLDPAKSYAVFIYPCTPNTSDTPPTCSSGHISGYITGTNSLNQPKDLPAKTQVVESIGQGGGIFRKLKIILNRE